MKKPKANIPVTKKVDFRLRAATVRDATALYDMLLAYFALNPKMPAPLPNPTMAWGLGVIMRDGCVIAEIDGKIVGSLGVERGNFPWNPGVPYLNMVWLYVIPERRGGGTANRLLKAAKDIAANNGIMVRVDNIWGIDAVAQDRWREIHGFQYVGGNYVWHPPPPEGGLNG